MPPGPTPLVPKPQALRYRRGKLPTGAPIPSDSDDSDDDSGDEDDDELNTGRKARSARVGIKREEEERDGVVAGGAGRVIHTGSRGVSSGVGVGGGGGKRNIQVALRDVRVEEDGAVYVGGKREVGGGVEEEEEEGESGCIPLGILGEVFLSGPFVCIFGGGL